MEQYINKSALVAEIKRKKDICKKVVWDLRTQENKDYYQGKAEAYSEMAELIDTLEVKEVDLEKEYDKVFFKDPVFGKLVNRNAGISIARHFFELGIKTKKGE